MTRSIQAINQQLQALHLQIHKLRRQMNSCESLEETYDTMKTEEKAVREKCISLQKEARELCDKVKNHSIVDAKCKDVKVSNEVLDCHLSQMFCCRVQILQQNIQVLKKRLKDKALEDRFNERKAESEGLRREQEELQNETSLEEMFAAMKKAAQAVSQQNNTMQEEILQHHQSCETGD